MVFTHLVQLSHAEWTHMICLEALPIVFPFPEWHMLHICWFHEGASLARPLQLHPSNWKLNTAKCFLGFKEKVESDEESATSLIVWVQLQFDNNLAQFDIDNNHSLNTITISPQSNLGCHTPQLAELIFVTNTKYKIQNYAELFKNRITFAFVFGTQKVPDTLYKIPNTPSQILCIKHAKYRIH